MYQANRNELKIIQLNVRSLIKRSRRHDLFSFLQQHQPHVVLLCETHLRPIHCIEFKDYDFIRQDVVPGTIRTGSAILIKSNIRHQIIDTSKWNLTSLECTSVQIITDGAPISLISAYRSSSDNTNYSFCNDLSTIIGLLQASGPFIIGGDLNARHTSWLNNVNCAHGIRLFDWYQANTLNLRVKLLHTQEPTFYRGGTVRSFLDLILISDYLDVKFSPTLAGNLQIIDYPSDHRAVLLNVGTTDSTLEQEPRKFLDYSNTNWQNYQNAVEDGCANICVHSDRNMSPREIELAVDGITQLLNETTRTHVPVKIINKNTLIRLPQILLDLILYKKSLRRRWQRHHYNPNEHSLKSEIKCVEKLIQERLALLYNDRFTKALQDIQVNHEVFKNINKLTARQKRIPMPVLSHQGHYIEDDREKANLLGAHFKKVHQQTLHLGDATFTNTTNQTISNEFGDQYTPKVIYTAMEPANPSDGFNLDRHLVSIDNLSAIIKSRRKKKSSGLDNIPSFLPQKLGPKFLELLAVIINQAYNIRYFPQVWKVAKVIPICKHGKPADTLDSYRPISLLPCLSKIYECAIKEKLMVEVDDQHILPEDQFGFRSRRATTHPLVVFQNDIVTGLQKRAATIAVSLDVAKAFDTAWIEGLIYKLANIYQLDRHLCGVIYQFMASRAFHVQLNDKLSDLFTTEAGVPQGGVLSAILYILFIADMPKPHTHINAVKRLQYADDTLIYVSVKNVPDGVNRLNLYIGEIISYQTRWKISCSPTKCETIVFKGPDRLHSAATNRACKNVSITIGTQTILPKPQIKYLGITFAKDARHIKHVTEVIRKTNAAVHAVQSILSRRKGASIRVRKLCYKQLVRPCISYGFACWSGISSHQMERLRLLERKCLRQITNTRRPQGCFKYLSNTKLYAKAEINKIDHMLAEQACRFFEKVDVTETPLLANCFPLQDEVMTIGEYNAPYLVKYLHDDSILSGGTFQYYHRRHRPSHNTSNVYINS